MANVAATGEDDIIARNGRPMAKIVLPTSKERTLRVGFMKGKGTINVPENFNDLRAKKIEELFSRKK